MPLTEFQRSILLLLREHRNPNSYVAGGVAIHRGESSLRRSSDIDFFHDTDEAVSSCSRSDLELLRKSGYSVELLIDQPSYVRAVIRRGSQSLKLEWARDTAFRFFPAVEDDELGYRLHDVDLAVNKCLALANRNEVRDIIDLIQMHRDVIALYAACWGACGKDPGFTPELLLDCMKRNSIIRPEQLAAESLTRDMSPVELKEEWLALLSRTEEALASLPPSDLGCVYLDPTGEVVHSPAEGKLDDMRRHFGSVGGSWPRVAR
jgi:hypothetical protein